MTGIQKPKADRSISRKGLFGAMAFSVVLASSALILNSQTKAEEGNSKALSEKSQQKFDPDRFALVTTKTGVVRIDRETGSVTFCSQREGTLRCQLAADERTAWQAELDTMAKRLKALEARLEGLELATATQQKRPSASKEEGFFSKKTQDDIDEMLSAAEKVVRRFAGSVKEWSAPSTNAD